MTDIDDDVLHASGLQQTKGSDQIWVSPRLADRMTRAAEHLADPNTGPNFVFAPPESLSDERLAEIELCSGKVRIGPDFDVSVSHLVAEVKRLRRENHLLSLSRGHSVAGLSTASTSPSIVGGD